MLEELVETLVENPTEENKNTLIKFINEVEFSLLEDAYTYPEKSWDYFNKKREAFSYRGDCAKLILTKWVAKYGSTEGCPVSYADTLNVPFKKIDKPE